MFLSSGSSFVGVLVIRALLDMKVVSKQVRTPVCKRQNNDSQMSAETTCPSLQRLWPSWSTCRAGYSFDVLSDALNKQAELKFVALLVISRFRFRAYDILPKKTLHRTLWVASGCHSTADD